ncbi:response regulator [Quadrisphaera sp. DSM 44207]|uniref:response regulator n=1 Tax=Quadrisphaera sp. DSM 44207 TaxID=1881057 RepID=UPI00088103EB|nr:response regulator [Quadrisphaera sp. DSM 44207]SDQ87882.1 Histidine kinase-, DNA gyrase B-, and HSP90-like ATPase [Quadrisphaera sp. DSM 44207]
MSAPTARPGTDLDPALGDLLAQSLSRGVRTPLHSLLGFLELLATSGVDAEQRRLVDQLVTSSEELVTSGDRLVWLLRVLGGAPAPPPQPVRVADLLDELAGLTGAPVVTSTGPGAPRGLTTDVPALSQLLSELLGNAVLHGGAPVVLAVAQGAAPGRVRLSVADAGPGLPEPAQRALLAAPGPLSGATPVGLLLVRRLADRLGGRLDVASSRAGTRITVDLPVDPSLDPPVDPPVDPPARPAARPTVPGGAGGAPLRVLLVEDNATNRLLAQRQLQRLGHELTAVATGEEGVRAALAGGADVVLMDLHLPDVDGAEATRRIRAAEADAGPGVRRLPVVAVTADATPAAREACLAAGVDAIVHKPVDLEELGAVLRRVAGPAASSGPAAAAGPSRPVPPVVRRLAGRVDGDPDAVAQFVTTYLGELPGRRLRIQASLRRAEPRAVLAAAESLRASSETMGAAALAGACAALGAAVRGEDLDTARAFLPSLLLQCQQLQEDLAPYTEPGRVAAALAVLA